MKQTTNQFLLLDFGHPMTEKTVELLKISLKNIITLATAFPGSLGLFYVGITIMNSEFSFIESTANLEKNYNLIISKLNDLDKISANNGKITVREYKQLLKNSIVKILGEYEAELKKTEEKKFFTCRQETEIKMTLVTKKTVTLLRDILINVMNKLPASFSSNKTSVKNIKIIQILNEEETNSQIPKKNNAIEMCTCSHDLYSLECAFKDWLLKRNTEQQIEILLSEDINIVVKCDIEDSIVKPQFYSFGTKLDLWDNVLFKALDYQVEPVSSERINTLKVLRRIPLTGVCPTLVFGIPRRLHASTSSQLSWNESEVNRQIFKELCGELLRTQQGLIVKSKLSFRTQDVSAYYFLSSGDEMLLLSSLASHELHILQRQCVKNDVETDPNAISVVRACLRNIQFTEEYSPTEFSSRIYEYLNYHLMQTIEKSSFLGHIDPNLKNTTNLPIKPCQRGKRKPEPSATCHLQNTTIENKKKLEEKSEKDLHQFQHPGNFQNSQAKKRQKEEHSKTHPALLPPQIVKKYRKGHPSLFVIPELNEDYNIDLNQ